MSACVGADGSILCLPDHLWVPVALPSVSRLGSACQLANAVHLLVPAISAAVPICTCAQEGTGLSLRGQGLAVCMRGQL